MAEVFRRSYDVADLARRYPPAWHNRNKEIVHSIACPGGDCGDGTLEVTRWSEFPLPDAPARKSIDVQRINGGFRYIPHEKGAVVWALNFADPELFGYYAGGLFAQDEIQVTEHPALAAVRSALAADHGVPRTVEHGRPTPVLVRNVPRCCFVRTKPSPGAPRGLYGNEFAEASEEAIRNATVRIHPPARSNIIAIAAPSPTTGHYWRQQIESALVTAYSGFHAATLESARVAPGVPVEIHTGFWGCGAFGGNPVLMSIVQVVAAKLAGLDRIVFHVFMPSQSDALDEAMRVEPDIDPVRAIDQLDAMNFEWGRSDGN